MHFIGLVNVVNLKAGGLGALGAEQLEWLEKDVKRSQEQHADRRLRSRPAVVGLPEWGWGTDDSAQALSYLKRFGSVTVLNGHIHQVMQKVEGNVTFHTALSTAFPQPAPGSAPSPGPMKVEADRLKKMLGLARMSFHDMNHPIAITDVPLEEEMQTAGAGAREIVVDNFNFAPANAAVAAGSTVTWTNRDDVPHNIVSTGQAFKSPVLDTDEQFSHTFNAPGTYKYFCSIHPRMTGQNRGGVRGMRNIRWGGAAVLGVVLMAVGTAAADRPVHEIEIIASRYALSPSTIQVNAGESVRIVIRSADGVHGFAIPALKLDAQVPKGGDAVKVEFTAPPAGRYEIACSEFCGRGHGQMKAALISVGPTRTSR